MIVTLPLRLRGIEIAAPIDIEICGARCLLTDPGSFLYALPGQLYRRVSGSLVKRRSSRPPAFGFAPGFSPEAHLRAFEILAEGTFPLAPRHLCSCSCSNEYSFVEGDTPWVAFSAQAPRLAELYPVRRLETLDQAAGFVRRAWETISAFNRLGLTHGDPAYQNFLISGSVSLVDLDSTFFNGEAESLWDRSVFVHSTIVPVLAGFLPLDEMADFAQALTGSPAAFLRPGMAHALEFHRCSRAARSAALNNGALAIQVRAHAAGASVAAQREMDMLRRVAREREETIVRIDGEAAQLRQTIARLLNADPTSAGS